MSEYPIKFSRFALEWAIIFFLMSVTGGLIASLLVGIDALYLSLPVGTVFCAFVLLFELATSPYRLSIDDDGIALFFRLRPSKFIYYVEIKGVVLDPNDKVPALRLKGTRIGYSISSEAAKEISKRVES
jgi:hypothetical protein